MRSHERTMDNVLPVNVYYALQNVAVQSLHVFSAATCVLTLGGISQLKTVSTGKATSLL